jgi:hypothetical protein
VGNMRRFQANQHSPVYAELVALIRKTLGTVPVLRDALRPLPCCQPSKGQSIQTKKLMAK